MNETRPLAGGPSPVQHSGRTLAARRDGFDALEHARRRRRQAEARAEALDKHRCELERVLIYVLAVASVFTGIPELELLRAAEAAARPPMSDDELRALLREPRNVGS